MIHNLLLNRYIVLNAILVDGKTHETRIDKNSSSRCEMPNPRDTK